MNNKELKSKRKSKKILQKDIAKLLNISTKTVCLYENNSTCKYSIDQIIKLAIILELNMFEVNNIFFDSRLPIGN